MEKKVYNLYVLIIYIIGCPIRCGRLQYAYLVSRHDTAYIFQITFDSTVKVI